MDKQLLGALLLITGALWLIIAAADRPAVPLSLVAAFMLYWAFRRRE